MTTFPAPEAREQIVDQVGVDRVISDQAVVERKVFDEEVVLHDRRERRLLWKELACIAFVAVVVVVRHFWLT